MIEAVLKHKVPLSEDVLTSVVLGALSAYPARVFSDLISTRCESITGSAIRPDLTGELEWCFWPNWDGDEPDLVVSDESNICVVEVKWGAPFGEDSGRGHQLEKYWRSGTKRSLTSNKTLWLIALTDDPAMPADAIRSQLPSIEGRDLDRVLWISWTDVYAHIRSSRLKGGRVDVKDVIKVLSMADLDAFEGFDEAIKLGGVWDGSTWRFEDDGS